MLPNVWIAPCLGAHGTLHRGCVNRHGELSDSPTHPSRERFSIDTPSVTKLQVTDAPRDGDVARPEQHLQYPLFSPTFAPLCTALHFSHQELFKFYTFFVFSDYILVITSMSNHNSFPDVIQGINNKTAQYTKCFSNS